MLKDTKNIPTDTVHNVLEYMGYISKYNLTRCVSRGESKWYSSLTASAFRQNSYLDIQKMVRAFEQQVGNTLTDMQKKHILAFSQHHGLPTNLLDFTFSPLVSLYFACGGAPDTHGYVYFLNKDRLINISEHLELINTVLFPSLLVAGENLRDILERITDVFIENENYVFEFLTCMDDMIGATTGNEMIHKEIIHLLNNRAAYEIDKLDPLISAMKKRLKCLKGMETEVPLSDLGSYACLYVQMIWVLLFITHHDGPFRTPFYFTYEPANVTNRISNQSSIFIYQLYGINEVRQEIHPDMTLKIENKAEIIEELDCLGINEQFIFNDYDHVASYIKKKYLKRSDELAQNLAHIKEISTSLV